MITLERYSSKHNNDFIKFIEEFQRYGDEFDMMGIINVAMHSNGIDGTFMNLKGEQLKSFFKLYMKFVDDMSVTEKVPVPGWVEADEYAICKDDTMIGRIIFRRRLTKYLLLHSFGHIGYAIRQSERGNGYGGNARYGENNSGYIQYVYIETSKHELNCNITTYTLDNNTTTTIISEYVPPVENTTA